MRRVWFVSIILLLLGILIENHTAYSQEVEPSIPLRHKEGKQYHWHVNVDSEGNFYRGGNDEWHSKGNAIDFGVKDWEAGKNKKPEEWKADLKKENEVEVIASFGGTIVKATTHNDGRGGEVVIEREDGIKATYMHIRINKGIKEGMNIEQGKPIGVVAYDLPKDKYWTGPHLHFQIDPPEKAKDFTLEGKKFSDFKAGMWYFSRHDYYQRKVARVQREVAIAQAQREVALAQAEAERLASLTGQFIETLKGIPKAFDDLEHGRLEGTLPQTIYDASTLFLQTLLGTRGYSVYRHRDLEWMQKALDSTRSVAHISPGHPNLNVSQDTLASLIQPTTPTTPFTPTTIFSDDFESGLNTSVWSTAGGIVGDSSIKDAHGVYAFMNPWSGTSASMSHTFTLLESVHIKTSFDYMVRLYHNTTDGYFRATLDNSSLLNVNIPSDLNTADYVPFGDLFWTTTTWSSHSSGCSAESQAAGSHEIKFETVRSSGDANYPIVYVDEVKIETCQ